MKAKTHTKLNISIPTELHQWVVDKKEKEQKKSKYARVGISNIITEAIQAAKDDDERGNGNPSEHANVIRPSASGVGGSSTRQTLIYRKTGKVK